MREAILRLFERTFGQDPEAVHPVSADGSRREYYRLWGGPHGTLVGAFGPDPDENRAFLSYSRTFRALDFPVPEVYAVDEPAGVWLLEDLGNRTLFAALGEARSPAASLGASARGEAFPASILPAYDRVVKWLPRFQFEGGRSIDFSFAHPRPEFDETSMRWDLNYFKYHFLKLAHIPFHEERLEEDFGRLTAFLLEADRSHFLYRDFQSRNILLRDGEPWFVDFQGGRRGALHYDVASLLYDGRAALPDSIRAQLLGRYLDELAQWVPVDRDRFEIQFRGFVLIRIMQAMGAYGYRGFFERKPLFLESVPYAARNLAGLLDTGLPLALPELEAVYERIVDRWPSLERAVPDPSGLAGLPDENRAEGLTVQVESFSYRKGYPEDDRGHGGGFVFDCRSLPNPGRDPRFADLTGVDAEVADFLARLPEAEAFWNRVLPLVEAHVASYLERGFSDLSVAFGCTGGQHRSVYFAERLSRHLEDRFPEIRVRPIHREAAQWPVRTWTA